MTKPIFRPNFLVIGAPKCGTTSIDHFLRGHPDVHMPTIREPCFFSRTNDVNRIQTLEQYLALFGNASGQKLIGEVSPTYLYSPQAPQAIRDALGEDVKLVAVLRNPADAAYSLWRSNSFHAIEPLGFRDALDAEAARRDEPSFTAACASRGIAHPFRFYYSEVYKYVPQIERFLAHFRRDRLKIFIFEELFAGAEPKYGDLLRFLEIAEDHRVRRTQYNAGRTIRTRWFHRVLSEEMAWKNAVKWLLPQRARTVLRTKLRRLNSRVAGVRPMENGIRRQLEARFAPDVRRLEQVLGRDLSQIWF